MEQMRPCDLPYCFIGYSSYAKTNDTMSNQQMNREFLFRAISVVMITVWTAREGRVTEYD